MDCPCRSGPARQVKRCICTHRYPPQQTCDHTNQTGQGPVRLMYGDWCKIMNKLFSRDILERKDRKKQVGGDVEMTDVSILANLFYIDVSSTLK